MATYQAADKAGALTLFGIGELGFNSVLSIALASFYGAMAGPTAHMRIYTAKNQKTAKRGILVAAIVVGCFSILPAIVGMSGFTLATMNGS